MIEKSSSVDRTGAHSPDEVLRLLHETQVRQVELEIQNEELRMVRTARELAEEQYAELYELAPVGYVTVNGQGLVIKANLTAIMMLGVVRDALIMAPLGRHVAPESQDVYHCHCQALQADGVEDSCELQMLKSDGTPFWVNLNCSAGMDAQGGRIYRAVISDISKQRSALDALRESEARYRFLYQSMMDGFVVMDMDGRLTDWNQVFQEMLGYPAGELGGMAHHDMTPERWRAVEARMIEEQVLSRGYSDLYEKEYVRADGAVVPVELRVSMIRGADGNPKSLWAMVRDVTDRKQNELTMRDWNQTLERRVAERTAELHESEARFRLLVEASFEGVVISSNGVIIDGNRQFGDIYHCDVSELIGRSVSELIAPEFRALVAGRIAREDEDAYEFVGIRDDGTRVCLEAHGRMMTWQGAQNLVIAVRDLTDEREAQAKLESQKAELDQALRLAIISEVCAGIIHQIGQPLSAAGANIAVASARLNTCNKPVCGCMEMVRAVESDLKRMRELVSHLRALANPERPERKPIDFNELVSNALGQIRSDARRQHLEFNVNLAGELPLFSGDCVQLSQMVINLVRNAIEASADFPVERRVVEISTWETSGRGIELSIRDRGVGMAPEALDQLFTPFFSTKTEGLGVGLRLCRTIVEAHGGSIRGVNNSDGPGMTFSVLLLPEAGRPHTKV